MVSLCIIFSITVSSSFFFSWASRSVCIRIAPSSLCFSVQSCKRQRRMCEQPSFHVTLLLLYTLAGPIPEPGNKATIPLCGILRGRFKVSLYSVFAIHAQDMTSQALYLRYSAYDVIVYVRSQTLHLRYSACGLILETKVTFMMESKTGFEISTKVTCQS